jgi:hypothetical protein
MYAPASVASAHACKMNIVKSVSNLPNLFLSCQFKHSSAALIDYAWGGTNDATILVLSRMSMGIIDSLPIAPVAFFSSIW